MKKIGYLLKKLIVSFLLLYSFDAMVSPLSLIVPINILTVSFIFLFGPLGLIFLILVLVILF